MSALMNILHGSCGVRTVCFERLLFCQSAGHGLSRHDMHEGEHR